MSCRYPPSRQKGLTRGYLSIILLSGSDSGKEFLLEGGVGWSLVIARCCAKSPPLSRSEDVLTLADLKILTGLNLTYLLLHPVVASSSSDTKPPGHEPWRADWKGLPSSQGAKGFFPFQHRPSLERRLERCDVLLVTATLTRSGDGMVASESWKGYG